jgi:5'-nucleotidase
MINRRNGRLGSRLGTVVVMRILVTNDDGIDSIGLHVLARSLVPLGDVIIVAPNTEYSGYGAAFGSLNISRPEVHKVEVDGVAESWSVTGPPALCVLLSRLGAFGPPFDLIVAGINPGANVGRSIYHSGTVGAALTARSGGVSGIAISQAVREFGIEGQAWDQMLLDQRWESAGAVAALVVAEVLSDLPRDPVLINVNVPNLPLDQIKGWRRTTVGVSPNRALFDAKLEPIVGLRDAFSVTMSWGDILDLPPESDGGAIRADEVSITYLSRMMSSDAPCAPAIEQMLTGLVGVSRLL